MSCRSCRAVIAATAWSLGVGVAGTPALAQDDGSAADGAAGVTSAPDTTEGRRSFTRRPYVTLGGGLTRLEPESPTAALEVSEEISAGGELGIGYDMTRWLSGELYAADLGAAEIDFLGEGVGEVGYRVYGLTAIVYLLGARDGFIPFSDGHDGIFRREGLSLFARAGVGGMSNESDLSYERDHTAHAVFGAGLEYGFRNGVALRAEAQAFDTDARYAGLSLLKRFGRVPPAVPPPVVAVEAPSPLPLPAPPPDPTPAPLEQPPNVYFAFDVDTLSPAARAQLDELADRLEDEALDVEIDGHADALGSERYNEGLSDRRADSVRDHLVSRGVPADRIRTRGFGESVPIVSNDSEEGRALNRRVEIVLD